MFSRVLLILASVFVGDGGIALVEERLVLLKPVVQFYFTYGVSRGFLYIYSYFKHQFLYLLCMFLFHICLFLAQENATYDVLVDKKNTLSCISQVTKCRTAIFFQGIKYFFLICLVAGIGDYMYYHQFTSYHVFVNTYP